MKNYLRLATLCLVTLSLLVIAGGRAEATLINFETGAPSTFDQTTPLTELYAPLGVHFSGPAAGQGGAILDENGNFGLNAHSGLDFLAFNRSTFANDPETIRFDTLQSEVSIFAGAGGVGTYTLAGFDANGAPVASVVGSNASGQYIFLDLVGAGIRSVVLTETGTGAFVYDDLSFNGGTGPISTPEPATLMMASLGAIALAFRLARNRAVGA